MIPRPKKSLGQNFLSDPNYKKKIIESLNLQQTDFLLEIGPGRQALTSELARRCGQLWLIEKDRELSADLQEAYKENPHIKIHNTDVLDISLSQLFRDIPQKIKVVGNLPYNVASQIFIHLVENHSLFSDLYLMFQKEMALRFVGKPKTKDYGLLTLWASIYTDCKILFHLPPTAFYPRPKVISSFIHFHLKDRPLLSDEEAIGFFQWVRLLFQQRRKTIRAILKLGKEIPFHKNRAEELSIEELIGLYREVINLKS